MIRQGLDSAGSLEPGDRHGSSLAVGDFNDDGYDDLAIGAPFEDVFVSPTQHVDAGAVVISYGSYYGITHVGAQLRTAQSIGGASQDGAQFGYALAAGDFDGDGDDDLAVGAPFETVSGAAAAGRVYILDGDPGGLAATLDRTIVQSDGGGGIEAGDEFGSAFAVGNFDGDATPREDIAIGTPGEDADAGVVFFFHGSVTGLTNLGAGWFKQSTLGFADEAGSRFGHALVAGAFVGSDDHVDLVVGAPYHDLGNVVDCGMLYAIFGSPAGLTAAGATQHTANTVPAGGVEEGALLGYSLAAARLASSQPPRVVVGEPFRTVDGEWRAGRVLVVPGGAGGLLFGATSLAILTQDLADGVNSPFDYLGRSVAAGDWDSDGRDDIAAGAPGKERSFWANVGLVQVFLTTSTGFGTGANASYDATTLSDIGQNGDELGYALAFGRFDHSLRGNMAIGCPGQNDDEDGFDPEYFERYFPTEVEDDAGCVFILAPWRQVLSLSSRNSVVVDCEDEIVFSQRPFDRVGPASTTKVMTALIALERTQLPESDPDHVPLDALYIVPEWVAEDIGGSSASLEEFERITLQNLLRGLMAVSGNDASYAIADLVAYGGIAGGRNVSLFAAEMRQRATTIGMTRTYFGNPSGRDPWNALDTLHYTTAEDMVKLSRVAMENGAFRVLVGTPFWDITRRVVRDAALTDIFWTYDNSFIQGFRAWHDNASGIKPGGTTGAGNTRLFSADSSGRVIAGMFACPAWDDRSLSQQGAALVRLAFTECNSSLFFSVPAEPPPRPLVRLQNVATTQNSRRGGSSAAEEDETDSLLVEVLPEQVQGSAQLRLWTTRRSTAVLGMQELAQLGLAPFESHGGIRIRNVGPDPATLGLNVSHPPTSGTYVLGPEQELAIPAHTGMLGPTLSISVQNAGADSVAIEITEHGYEFDLGIPATGAGFTTTLTHGPAVFTDGIEVETQGLDANPGNEVEVRVRPPGAPVVGVGGPVAGPGDRPGIRMLPAWPNPFRERVQLFFDLARAGEVRVAFYDLQGRRVRSYPAERLGPGRWNFEWAGEGERGERLPSGVYFARIALDQREFVEQRLVLVR